MRSLVHDWNLRPIRYILHPLPYRLQDLLRHYH